MYLKDYGLVYKSAGEVIEKVSSRNIKNGESVISPFFCILI